MIEIDLFWIVTLGVVLAGLFLLKELIYKGLRNKSLNITTNKDIEITKIFTDKYPFVSLDFIKKNEDEKSIENNQEIHELNKKFELMEKSIKLIEEAIRNQANIIERLQKNG